MFKLVSLLCLSIIARSSAISIGFRYHPVGDKLPGTPTGRYENISGINTYVSLPKDGHYDRHEAILFLTDVFGLPLVNSRILADRYAAEGYAVYAPDYLFNDPLDPNDPAPDIPGWLVNHGTNVTLPAIYAVRDALISRGVRNFAATGYCFGGLYTLLLAQKNEIKVGTVAHPGLWEIPDDLLILRNSSHVPFQVHSAELDTSLTPALAQQVDDVLLGHGNFSALKPYRYGYERIDYKGQYHGFAVRPTNASNPADIAALDKAFKETSKWFRKHL